MANVIQLLCHCEPVRTLVWQSVRPSLEKTDSHASGAPRSESTMEMIAGGNHTIVY